MVSFFSFNNKVNLLVLSLSILLLLLFPFKKGIWYDESVSVIASKGITYDTKAKFDSSNLITSGNINNLNDIRHVFIATVMDNNNSFLYNVSLHYFTSWFGNGFHNYILFSRLFGALSLICLYLLCRLLLRDSIFISAAILFLLTDLVFWGMSNEIRAYSMGVFFVILSTYYLFRYLDKHDKRIYLLLFGLSSVAALLVHFFCCYIIFILCLYLFYKVRFKIITLKNIAVLLPPILILGIFFYVAHSQPNIKLHTMILNNSNTVSAFNAGGAITTFAKFTSVNFRLIFPLIINKTFISLISFAIIIIAFLYGCSLLKNRIPELEKLMVLFALGMISSVFLAAMSFKVHAYSPFYYRYFLFSIPFSSVFLALFLKAVSDKYKNKIINVFLFIFFFVPSTYVFSTFIKHTSSTNKNNFNHIEIAGKILSGHITEVGVPDWDDALLVQCFIPAGYNINYELKKNTGDFILYNNGSTLIIPVVRITN